MLSFSGLERSLERISGDLFGEMTVPPDRTAGGWRRSGVLRGADFVEDPSVSARYGLGVGRGCTWWRRWTDIWDVIAGRRANG